ncbi:hypothetical protein SDC9_132591 [bioreactor metagenome]|uniref:Uncharacterized protein n=1 Tax=bioreactor metagenome TaxID=1076179 RepID=A0A645D7K7_9ZZZZ
MVRQQHVEDARTVERRYRNEVEGRQPEVDIYHQQNELLRGPTAEEFRREARQLRADESRQHVACDSRKADDYNVTLGVLEVTRVYRHRLGPAEAEEQQAKRAERIKVVEGVQREASRALRRGVPEHFRGKAVAIFMKCNGPENGGQAQKQLRYSRGGK